MLLSLPLNLSSSCHCGSNIVTVGGDPRERKGRLITCCVGGRSCAYLCMLLSQEESIVCFCTAWPHEGGCPFPPREMLPAVPKLGCVILHCVMFAQDSPLEENYTSLCFMANSHVCPCSVRFGSCGLDLWIRQASLLQLLPCAIQTIVSRPPCRGSKEVEPLKLRGHFSNVSIFLLDFVF